MACILRMLWNSSRVTKILFDSFLKAKNLNQKAQKTPKTDTLLPQMLPKKNQTTKKIIKTKKFSLHSFNKLIRINILNF